MEVATSPLTTTAILGGGQATKIDSLEIRWPVVKIDKFSGLGTIPTLRSWGREQREKQFKARQASALKLMRERDVKDYFDLYFVLNCD